MADASIFMDGETAIIKKNTKMDALGKGLCHQGHEGSSWRLILDSLDGRPIIRLNPMPDDRWFIN